MEENKSVQYTFAPEEKEILKKLAVVETAVSKNISEKHQRELITTKYYSEFVINTPKGPITLNNVFITSERNKEGDMSYHFRWLKDNEDGEQIIEESIAIDENGEVYVSEALKDYLGDAIISQEELMKENDNPKRKRLKGISEIADKKSIKQYEQENQQEDEINQVEADLQQQGEDLKISGYRKIKDTHVGERMPEVFEKGTENGLAFSNKLNSYVLISKVDGKYQLNKNVEPAKLTWKSIISIDPNGEGVERKVPHGLMKTNRDDKEIAVTIGQYGEPDIETVDVLPCQERISREVRSEGEGLEKQESLEIRKQFEQQGTEFKHDIAHNVQDIEEEQKEADVTVDYNITPDDYIPNTETTWGKLMEETGESLPKLIERYNREISKEGADSKKVVEIIEYDYGIVNHQKDLENQ